jgi:Mechanosensitive ion channel
MGTLGTRQGHESSGRRPQLVDFNREMRRGQEHLSGHWGYVMEIRSRARFKAALAECTLHSAALVLLALLITAAIAAQVAPPSPDFPSDQQVLAFLTESIDWYRHRAAEEQVATEPADLLFLEDNRPVATQIVQLSFEFAKADASIPATFPADSQRKSAAIASGSSAELEHFADLENRADLATQQAQEEIETIKKKLVSARGAERRTLQAELDVTQRRLIVLEAELASLRELVDYVQVTAGRQQDLASSIEDLSRTVPELTNHSEARSRAQNPDVASFAKPRDSGILGLSADVSRLGRKLRVLDDEIRRTEKLRQSSADVHSPFLAYANKLLPISADNKLQGNDLKVLQQQKAELDGFIALAKALAPAIVALDKQNVLLAAYVSRLHSWRAAVQHENAKAWRNLILRLVGAAAAIGGLLLIGAAARRLTDHHVEDIERRHVFRVIGRVVPWVMIVVVVAVSFTSDLTSLATFFGLLTAGVAIALQNVIVSALGYFFLVGKRGIRVGDRVQISGTTGDVTYLGWLQFQIREIDKRTQQPTGDVVTFPNSLVLSSGGLGKFDREDVMPAQLEVGGKPPRL